VVTFGIVMSPDGKSFLYALPSQRDVSIYRQPWHDGTVNGDSDAQVNKICKRQSVPLEDGQNARKIIGPDPRVWITL
jgi:hypothetical protein